LIASEEAWEKRSITVSISVNIINVGKIFYRLIADAVTGTEKNHVSEVSTLN